MFLLVFGSTACSLFSQMFVFDNNGNNNDGDGLCSGHEGHHRVANIAYISFLSIYYFPSSSDFSPTNANREKIEIQAPTYQL